MGSNIEHRSIRTDGLRFAIYLALATIVLVALFWLEDVVLLSFLGLVLAILLDVIAWPAIRFLKMRRGVAVVLAALVFVLGLFGVLSLLVVPMLNEGTQLVHSLPQKMSNLHQHLDHLRQAYPFLDRFLPSENSSANGSGTNITEVAKKSLVTASTAFKVGADALATFFLGIFLAWHPERWLRGIAVLWPGGNVEARMALLRRTGSALRSYLLSLAVAIVVMGSLWTLGLWAAGVDYPLFFGVIGGIVEVVPYLGPLIGLVPPLIMAMTMGPMKVVYVLVLYAILHVIEGYILVPLVMHEREHLPPPLVVLSIMVFGTLFGILGVVLAVPLGTVGYVWLTETVYKKRERS